MSRNNSLNRALALVLSFTALVATMRLVDMSNGSSVFMDSRLVEHSVEGGIRHESL